MKYQTSFAFLTALLGVSSNCVANSVVTNLQFKTSVGSSTFHPQTITLVTTREVATELSSQWDISGGKILKVRDAAARDHVRLVIHAKTEATLLELKKWEEKSLLTIEKITADQIKGIMRQLDDSIEWDNFGCYRTVDEIFASMSNLVKEYPGFVNLTSVGHSWRKKDGVGGFDIQAMILTAPIDSTTPKHDMVVVGGVHSRELTPPETILRWAEHLLAGYKNDADITWILNRTNIHLIPLVNPDGREIAQQHLDWYYRKNANSYGCSDIKQMGVDLNRNYPMWYMHEGTSSSEDPCRSTYHGSGALSEPESQAVYQYIHELFPKQQKRAAIPSEAEEHSSEACPMNSSGILLDVHSAGELVYFPWGHEDLLSPNHKSLLTLAAKLAYQDNYALWGPGQDDFLYFVGGDLTDSAYGIDCVASFGFEIGTEWYASCEDLESKIVPSMMDNFLYAAKVVAAPYSIPLGPDVLSIQISDKTSESHYYLVTVNATSGGRIVEHAVFEEGTEPIYSIATILLFVDVHPDDVDSANDGIPMTATDGSFDQSFEVATFQLHTTDWEGGSRHILYVQATDDDGNTGPVSAIYFQV